MAGVPLRQSVSASAGTTNSTRNLSSSGSPCSLSLHIFTRRPVGRSRTFSVGVSPVARFGRGGGGGYRPFPGRGGSRRLPGNRPPPSDADDEALDFSRLVSSSVRLIDDQQNMIGVVPLDEAIQRAEDAALDLVILSADADPPVLRIVDYNKYKYEQQKKKKDQQKKSAASRMDMKEVKMGYNIDSHDYTVRLKAAQRFLKDGDKVKVIVNLKKRENDFKDMAIELLKRFQEEIGELGTEESKNFNDRNVFIVMVPNKLLVKKAPPEPAKKKEGSPVPEVSANL